MKRALQMKRAKYGVALAALLVVTATAWMSRGLGSTISTPVPLDSLLAFMAFSMRLGSVGSMGFVFLLLTMGRLSALEATLMADAALILIAVVRRGTPSPRVLLESLAATSLAAIGSHVTYTFLKSSLVAQHASRAPIPEMAAAIVCFIGMHLFEWRRSVLWSFTYYVVVAALVAFSPVPAALPLLLLIFWRLFSTYERRLNLQTEESRQVRDLQMRTIEMLARAIEARGRPLKGGSRRVAVYTAELARELALEEDDCEALRVAALLYDVGELAIPEHILAKPGKLTAEEFEKVRTHPEVAAKILEHVEFPYPVAPIVLGHHEHWDGSGYPRALAGDQIPIGARILAAADGVDALASPRYHRAPLAVKDAVALVAAAGGTTYDPDIVAIIEKNYQRWERKVMHDPVEEDFTEGILSAQRDAQTLFDLTVKLGASLDLEETYQVVDTLLTQLVPCEALVVWIKRDSFVMVERAFGTHAAAIASLKMLPGRGISGDVAECGRQVVNGLASLDLEMAFQGIAELPFRHALSTQLCSGNIVGAVTLYRAGDRRFTPEHARFMDLIAPKLAAAMDNGYRFRQASKAAGADELTGLPNMAALTAKLANLNAPCALVVCDLDGFKSLNDSFGHLTGNRVLQAVAKGLSASCREGDFVARLGGDEFVLLLPGAQTDDWGPRLAGFKDTVRDAGERVTGGRSIDASLGVSFYPTEGTTAEVLMAKADERMYQEKGQRKKLRLIRGGLANTG